MNVGILISDLALPEKEKKKN